jgi:hypothetical protein
MRHRLCVCHSEVEWGRQKIEVPFEMGMLVGARRTDLCQELKHCSIFHTQQLPVCIKNGPKPK